MNRSGDCTTHVGREQEGGSAISRIGAAVMQSDRGIAVFIFLLALTVRLAHYEHLLQDEFMKYPTQAARFMAGEGEATRPFTASPLYLYFWVGVGRVLGGSFEAARVTQLVIGSASCALVALLGRGLFSPAAGLVAGVASALYLPFLAHDGAFVSEPLVVFLNLLSLWAFHRARGGRHWGLAAGALVLGLSAAARPNGLLLLPFFVAWGLRIGERTGAPASRRALGLAAVLLLGLVPPGLVTLRNSRVAGDFVPVMSDGGIVAYLGNNGMNSGFMYAWPRYEDLGRTLPGEVDPTHRIAHEIAEKETGRELSVSEATAFWTEQALDLWREMPLRALGTMVRKVGYNWTGYEAHDVAACFDIEDALRGRPYLLIFTLVGALGLVGAAWFLGRFRDFMPLYALIGAYTLTAVLFTVVARYRIPMVPALMLFGAGFCVEAVRQLAAGNLRRLVAPLVCAVILILAMGYRNYPMEALDAQYRVERETLSPAEAGLKSGKLEEARVLLERTIAGEPPYMTRCRAHGLLSVLHLALDNEEKARAHAMMGRGWSVDEADPHILVPPRQLLADPLAAAWLKAAEHLRAGDAAQARRRFAGLSRRAAHLVPLRHNLGLSLMREGRIEEGLHDLRLARMKDPSCLPTHQLIVESDPSGGTALVREYSELARKHATQPGFRYGLALALQKAGRPDEARREMGAARDEGFFIPDVHAPWEDEPGP